MLPAPEQDPDVDVVITEIGGTVGDIEGQPFLEAIRQFRLEQPFEDTASVHLTLVPYIATRPARSRPSRRSIRCANCAASASSPTSWSAAAKESRSGADARRKIALFCNLPPGATSSTPQDADSIYEVPLNYERAGTSTSPDVPPPAAWSPRTPELDGLAQAWCNVVLNPPDTRAHRHRGQVHRAEGRLQEHHREPSSTPASPTTRPSSRCGSIRRASRARRSASSKHQAEMFDDCHGILVPGGFGDRGIQGKVNAIRYARKHKHPVPGHLPGAAVRADRDRAQTWSVWTRPAAPNSIGATPSIRSST